MGSIKIGVVQTFSRLGEKLQNQEKAVSLIRYAAEEGADLIIFPEMFISGYLVDETTGSISEDCGGGAFRAVSEAAAENGINVIYGFPERNDKGKPFNSACFVGRDGALKGIYRKTHLIGEENSFLTPGTEYPVFASDIGRIGIMICYDVEFPEPARLLALNGAELIVCIAANMQPYDTQHARYAPVRAMENSVFLAYSNYTGEDRNYEYCGQSMIVDPDGEKLACAEQEETVLFAEADLKGTVHEDDVLNYLKHRRTGTYSGML